MIGEVPRGRGPAGPAGGPRCATWSAPPLRSARSGRTAHLVDTPFAERSAPDLRLPRTGYLVRQPLPDTLAVSPVVPWFGQRGGGLLVVLERPLRHLVDTGHLEPFAV